VTPAPASDRAAEKDQKKSEDQPAARNGAQPADDLGSMRICVVSAAREAGS
jgi:hypothetical protein